MIAVRTETHQGRRGEEEPAKRNTRSFIRESQGGVREICNQIGRQVIDRAKQEGTERGGGTSNNRRRKSSNRSTTNSSSLGKEKTYIIEELLWPGADRRRQRPEAAAAAAHGNNEPRERNIQILVDCAEQYGEHVSITF